MTTKKDALVKADAAWNKADADRDKARADWSKAIAMPDDKEEPITLEHTAEALDMVRDSLQKGTPMTTPSEPMPSIAWLESQLSVMDGCCLDNPEDVKRVAQHLYGNWTAHEQAIAWLSLKALEDIRGRANAESSPDGPKVLDEIASIANGTLTKIEGWV